MRFSVVQGIRGIAANLVVVSHLSAVEVNFGRGFVVLPNADVLGRLGVLLFFVVSGFVIAMVASRSDDWRQFLWARFTRIYPIYWFYTALALAAASIAPAVFALDVSASPSLIRSIFLIPDQTFPIVQVGWSLLYEVLFYLIFTVFLALRINLIAGLLAWSIILMLPIPSIGPISAVALDPIAFNFIGGALLWFGYSKLKIEFRKLNLGLLEQVGDASYSTYLSHVLLLSAIGAVFAALPWHSWIAECLFLIVCVLVANIWGWVSFRYIERPIIETSRHFFDRTTSPQPFRKSVVS